MTQVKKIDVSTRDGADRMAFGGLGQDLLNNTFGQTPAGTVYGSIHVREDSTISFKNRLPGGTREVTNQACLAGEMLYGEFYDVDVTAGSARGYIKEYAI